MASDNKNLIRDPYTTTLEGFSKVTNFLWDMLLAEENPLQRPREEGAELLQDDVPGLEINRRDEPGFEMVSETKLPGRPRVKRGDPLQAEQWASYFDAEGRVKCVEEIQQIIFRGGVDPAIRMDVWKYLLGYYSWGATTTERQQHRKIKIDEYFRIKLQWKTICPEQEKRNSVFRERKKLIQKDVARTDRVDSFFAGDKNPNLQVLSDVLMTYCMYDFDLGYVQGMSDLLSPLLVVMENEVDAFWCFAGFMERMRHNFEMEQTGVKTQLVQMQKLMQFYDPELYNYLESRDSGNFFFCFRWVLILFKREFPFHEIQRLWEVMWTDLPCENFHLLFALAILDTEKSTLMENKFGFSEILKHINDTTNSIPLEETLNKAEGICQQMLQYSNLPSAIREILGLDPPSPSTSCSDSGSPTAQGPCGGLASDSVGASAGAGSCVDGIQPSNPEDSSIVVLNEAADIALNYFFL